MESPQSAAAEPVAPNEVPAPPPKPKKPAEPWTWLPDGKGVLVGEKVFAFNKSKPERLEAFLEQLHDYSEVKTILLTAKVSFERGAAEFAGAADRLLELVRALKQVTDALINVSSQFGGFFDPPGILAELPGNEDLKGTFCNEAIERLKGHGH